MMDKTRKMKIFITSVVVYVVVALVALCIESRKRKRNRIIYSPMEERDKIRIEYLNYKIWRNNATCVNMLRLRRAPFFRFCSLLRDHGLLRDTINMCVEEQVAMFLNTVGHNLRNRLVATNYDRSTETVSRYFKVVLHAIGELRHDFIRPPSLEAPAKIAGNPRWDPYFKDCIGAIDDTHIRASVSKSMESSFRGRKTFCSQNVMAAVVLADALERENGLFVPQGKFYLVDAAYGAKPGFLPPFRGVRYHLNEWGNNPVQDEKELFDLRHSSLHVTVERAFASLKRRSRYLMMPLLSFPFQLKSTSS